MLFLLVVLLLLKVPITGAEVDDCVNGEVRLVEETSDFETVSGVVQLCVDGVWRTTCRSEPTFFLWNTHAADLVCRQLGYSSEGQGSSSGHNCTTKADFYIEQVDCETSTALEDCGYTLGTACTLNNCITSGSSVRRHATVTCLKADCHEGHVRLVGGFARNEGRVEVCVDGRWGTVCELQEEVPGYVCSQLGFPIDRYPAVRSFGPGFVPIRHCEVQGGGTILSCGPAPPSCDHSMDLGVVCGTYEQLYDELLNESSITVPPSACPTCQTTTCPDCPTVMPVSCDCPTCEEPTPCPTSEVTTSPTAASPPMTTESCDCPTCADPSPCPATTCPTCTETTSPPVTCPTCSEVTCPTTTCPTYTSPITTCPDCICPTCPTPSTQLVTSEDSTCTPEDTAIIAALGAVTGVLLVLLLGTVTALVVTCQLKRQAPKPRSSVTSGDKRSADQVYVAVNPAYDTVQRDHSEERNYEVINL